MSKKQTLKLILVGCAVAGAAEVGFEMGKGSLLGCMLLGGLSADDVERHLYICKMSKKSHYPCNLILFASNASKWCLERKEETL